MDEAHPLAGCHTTELGPGAQGARWAAEAARLEEAQVRPPAGARGHPRKQLRRRGARGQVGAQDPAQGGVAPRPAILAAAAATPRPPS